MQSVVMIGAIFIASCWVLVIGHQLGLDAFNPGKYAFLNASLALAYTGAGLSVCAVAVGAVVRLIR